MLTIDSQGWSKMTLQLSHQLKLMKTNTSAITTIDLFLVFANNMAYDKGLFTWKWGTSGRWARQSILTIYFFFLDLVHTWSGLPGKLVQITRFGGLTYLYVKAAVCGNPPNQGWANHCAKALQYTHRRTTWLPTATRVTSYFDDFTSKIAKTLMKLAVLTGDNLSVESGYQLISGIKLRFGLQQRNSK